MNTTKLQGTEFCFVLSKFSKLFEKELNKLELRDKGKIFVNKKFHILNEAIL
jgi:hypothetical protein